jgi:chaperonin GroES
MNVKPIGEKVVIKRLEAENVTKGGIVLPDSAKEKPTKGKILAIGNGKLLKDGSRSEFQVKVGDFVLFNSYGGNEIKIDDEEILIMDESEIMAILEEEN